MTSKSRIKNIYLCLIVFLTVLTGFLPQAACATDVSDAVVKIFVASNSIDFYRPWQSKGIKTSSGSGVIIEGNRILTNAHVVEDQTFIQVKKDFDPKKYTARAVAVGYDCDLALLEVDDPEFFEGVRPLKFGKLPKLKDTVTVMGYPQGGGKLSITQGVVSRIEINSYSQSGRKLLTVQIDAAINPGNSGGPVLMDGKLVGIAMQVFNKGQNIGYMIPIPIVDHFFQDLEDGIYDGFPILGLEYDTTENVSLRQHYHIDNKEGGVLITNVLPFSPAEEFLNAGDVILEISGVEIGEDGTFSFRDSERLSLTQLITRKQIQDDIKLKIVRAGETENLSVPLKPFQVLVPHPQAVKRPPYYIYGGLVFTVLTSDLLKSWGNRWWEKAPIEFTNYLAGTGRLNKDRKREVVVLLSVLSDEVNIGYHNANNSVINSINGKPFASFKDFVLLLQEVKNTQTFTVFETEQESQIILKNEQIDRIDDEILRRNNIPYRHSPEVGRWLSGPESREPIEQSAESLQLSNPQI